MSEREISEQFLKMKEQWITDMQEIYINPLLSLQFSAKEKACMHMCTIPFSTNQMVNTHNF